MLAHRLALVASQCGRQRRQDGPAVNAEPARRAGKRGKDDEQRAPWDGRGEFRSERAPGTATPKGARCPFGRLVLRGAPLGVPSRRAV